MSASKHISRRDLLARGSAAGGGLILADQLLRQGDGDALAVAAQGGGGKATGKKKPAGDPQVPTKVLGKTKEKIPILLMGGSMPFDLKFDPKLAECARYGVTYFDAADCYTGGTTEVAMGNYIKATKSRDKIWITSKSDVHEPQPFEDTVKTSLKKMQTDYINMYFLHMLRDPKYLSKDLEKTVARLKKEGKIRHFGFSCHHGNVAELLEVAARTPWVDSVMFRYNFRQYGDKELNKAMDAAANAGVGLIAMKTQGSAVSFEDKWKPLEEHEGWTQPQAVMKAVWADDRITAAVSSMKNLEILHENVAAALDKKKLGVHHMRHLHRYAEATRSLTCNGCDHICGAKVDGNYEIGSTLRYVMYHDVYGDPAEARRRYQSLPASAREHAHVDFSAAQAACPNGVDIARHMKRARDVLA